MLIRTGYDNRQFSLVDDKTGEPVSEGDTVITFRGEQVELVTGSPPHKPAASGSVTTSSGDSFNRSSYAGVVGLRWEPVE